MNLKTNERWIRHLKISKEDLDVTPPIHVYSTIWNDEIERDIVRMKKAHPQLMPVLTTYCKHHPCDGYIQGMNFLCNVFLARMDPRASFWALAKYMGIYRHVMPGIDKKGFNEFSTRWNKMFFEFNDKERMADEERVMALKWGVYSLTCHNTPMNDILCLWDTMIRLPQRTWPTFSAAVATAAIHRRLRKTKEEYDPRIMYTQIDFAGAEQLVRRALRIIQHRDAQLNISW